MWRACCPRNCRSFRNPSQVAVAEATIDLAGAAFVLRRDELRFSGDEETVALMHEMTQTFSAASTRIAHLEQAEAQ